MSAIKVENISKSFGKVKALNHVSFEAERGELFGLIGPDGAGKTTLLRLLKPSISPFGEIRGNIYFNGKNLVLINKSENDK